MRTTMYQFKWQEEMLGRSIRGGMKSWEYLESLEERAKSDKTSKCVSE